MPFAPTRRRVIRFKVERKHTEVYNANGKLKTRIVSCDAGYVSKVRAEINKYPQNVWDVEVYGEFAPMIMDAAPPSDAPDEGETDYVMVPEEVC